MSRSQPSTSATKSASAVIPASPGGSKGAPIRAASVPPTDVTVHPIPPTAKVKKGVASSRRKSHHTPSKGSSKHKDDSAKVPAATAKVGKEHKTKGKSPHGSMPPGEELVTTISSEMAVTCTTVTTAATTATCTTAATLSVCSILPKDQPSEAAGDGLVSPSTPKDTCTTGSTGSISAATTATCTTICTATCPASATILDVSSIPSGQPSEAAGDVLDPGHTT
ncbi:hypothetical protein NDU88_005251 [Pleurodeles waltl]|uniref:Uncharacterized protein n=1 Tax=Pleurodeles waltl TaxID=8319 RepID=A0AAV7W9W8_PLEWA|nr:hypothetical protein NDU88_005251 [Pleurodeles waltl]